MQYVSLKVVVGLRTRRKIALSTKDRTQKGRLRKKSHLQRLALASAPPIGGPDELVGWSMYAQDVEAERHTMQ